MQLRPLRALWLSAYPLLVLSCLLTAPPDEELVASCDDGQRNGGETDTDCGGPCATCGIGRICAEDDDCANGSCISKVCAAPSCDDGVQNGTETDVDCGGPDIDCNYCPAGKKCDSEDDCESFNCVDGLCADPSCTDGELNGEESDIDCGSACPASLCESGLSCYDGTDCVSGVCDASGFCQ